MARSPRVVAGVTVAVACAIGIELGAAVLGRPATPPSPRQTASTAVTRALDDAAAAGTFHYRATWSAGGLTQTIVGDADATAGTQAVDDDGVHFSVVVTDHVAYVLGDATALGRQLGLPAGIARAAQGTWVAVGQGDAPYPSVEEGVTTASALSQVVVDARTLATVHRGRAGRLTVVRGTMPVGTGRAVVSGSVRLEIAPRTKLPVEYAVRGSDGGVPWSSSISFSRWGEHLAVTAPPGAVPYTRLQLAA